MCSHHNWTLWQLVIFLLLKLCGLFVVSLFSQLCWYCWQALRCPHLKHPTTLCPSECKQASLWNEIKAVDGTALTILYRPESSRGTSGMDEHSTNWLPNNSHARSSLNNWNILSVKWLKHLKNLTLCCHQTVINTWTSIRSDLSSLWSPHHPTSQNHHEIFPSLLQCKLHRSLKMNSILETLAFTRRLTGEQVCRNWNEMTLLNCIYRLQQRPRTKKAQCFSCAVRRTHGLWPNHMGKKLIKLQHTHLPRFWFTGPLANFTGHHNHCEKCVHCVMRRVWTNRSLHVPLYFSRPSTF